MATPAFHLWLSTAFDTDDASPRRSHDAPHTSADRAKESHDTTLAAIQHGDAGAFTRWYAIIYDAAWRFAYRFTHDSDLARDVVHDVCVDLWIRRHHVTIHETLNAYVMGAIRHRALNLRRHDQIIEQRNAEVANTVMDDARMGMTHAPDAAITESMLHDAMRRHVAALPERQRTALVLRWEHGHSNAEIAAILGVGEAAVSRLLSRATATLRTAWDELVR